MDLPALPPLPAVSFVMPVLNEEDHLADAVRTILAQDYAGEKEIILALAPSTDRSTAIAQELADRDHRVRLVHNPGREIPIGLNLAIAASESPIIVRVDAHSALTPDYTRRGIEILSATGAANVGGIMRATGNTPAQQAIAAAYNSPFGLGGGTYHGDAEPGPAESAYLGIFRRSAILAVGGYDPSIRRGEDWELNLRIRRAGGTVWFDPALVVTYHPRASLNALARQFFATGAWRAVLVRRHPGETPWRFFVPGALVIALAACLVLLALQAVGAVGWSPWSLAYALPLLYVCGTLFAATRLPGIHGAAGYGRGFAVLITMHLCWGAGFVVGLLGGARNVIDSSRVARTQSGARRR